MASTDSNECFDDTTMEMLSANLPSSAFASNIPDPRLERARQEMERTNQITPLLKEELRLRILSKRLQKGEPEIEINPGEPRKYELTEEEKAKRERRNAQNRRAAKKCREKRKIKALTDAEKFRLIREQNQQLRNSVTYLLHKEEAYRKFCIEHILHNQCPSGPEDEYSRRRLLTLIGSNMRLESRGYRVPTTSSTTESAVGSQPRYSHAATSTSTTTDFHSNFQCHSQATFVPVPMSMSSSTAQAILQAEQSVTSMGELKEIPIHEISSLLPQESDFSVSDHSLESSPPGRSPSSLFPTMMSNSGGASYFSHLTPTTSYSNNINISSFCSSSDDIFTTSQTDNNILMSSSFLDSSVSTPVLHQDMSTNYLHGDVTYNDHIPKEVCAAVSHIEMSSGLHLPSQHGRQCVPPSKHDDTFSLLSGNIAATDVQNVFPLVVTTNNCIVNTAFLSELAQHPERFLSNFVNDEQLQNIPDGFSSFDEEPIPQTVPISPLTPLSPPSRNVTPSPNITQSPLSPSSLSVHVNAKDFPSAHTYSSTSYHIPVSPSTPARPAVRRMSSSTSLASPFSNHHVSIGLSPPPSVPSPTSTGVPESPPILTLSSACAETAYVPHISTFCAAASTDSSPARLMGVSEHDFN